jgi:hypothetical protein
VRTFGSSYFADSPSFSRQPAEGRLKGSDFQSGENAIFIKILPMIVFWAFLLLRYFRLAVVLYLLKKG